MSVMPGYLTIGDFARATHMTVKMLRHYDQIGLLHPDEVDPRTGCRRYTTRQIPTAQVIRRFRDLGMPLAEIRAVLSAPDLHTRNQRIAAHLSRLEEELGRTQSAVASLRDLLAMPSSDGNGRPIEVRTVPAAQAAAICDVVGAEESRTWLQGALGELRATMTARNISASGPAGGIYADEVFTRHRGKVTIFIPCAGPVPPTGRVTATSIPAADLAVIEHQGIPAEVDRAYGALASYVAVHALALAGPIREYYLAGQHDTPDPAQWRTEIGWPIFRTGSA